MNAKLLGSSVAALVLFTMTPALAEQPPPAVTRLKSPALVGGGVGVLLLGLGTGVGGGFLTFFASTQHACASYGCDPPPYALLGVAVPMQVVALSGIIGGIVMIAIGAHQVPIVTDTVALGPGGLRVRW